MSCCLVLSCGAVGGGTDWRLYIVCDNYGPHTKTEVTDWCHTNQVELVFTPSNA